jgi:methyl-accepting chemotaxis protein
MKRIMNFLASFSIQVKLMLLSIMILVPPFIITGYQEMNLITQTIQGEAMEKAQTDLQTGLAILDLKYPGDWLEREGKLLKGDAVISGNYEIVDYIAGLTNGDTVTIFLNDTRVTTNVLLEGQRAVGTKVSDVVADKVLKQGELYIGQANVVGNTYQAAYMPIKDSGGKIIGMWYVGAPDASERVQQIKDYVMVNILKNSIILISIALIVYYLFTRPIIRRIKQATKALEQISRGDLTVKEINVTSIDETGVLLNSVNKTVSDLRQTLNRVKDTAVELSASSEQLSVGAEHTSKATEQITVSIQEVALGAEQQASGIATVYQATREISDGMGQASSSVQYLADLSKAANIQVLNGNEKVVQTVNQMNKAKQSVELVGHVIYDLDQKAKEVGQIITLITEIANQTNLLALNAAIEAARAGENGRGFAVVATEIRKLAEQSGRASGEIRQLIQEIQEESVHAVETMNDGTIVVEEGIQMVYQTGENFKGIASTINDVALQSQELSAQIEQVNMSSQEILNTIETVADTVQQSSTNTQSIAAATEEQNASMEQIAASSEGLSKMAEELLDVVNEFKLTAPTHLY